MVEKKRVLILAIKRVSNLLNRHFQRVKATIEGLEEVSGMQGWVLGFLVENKDQDIFQKDIEVELDIRSSSATALLQRMEKKGLITRIPVPDDTRWKKIVPSQKAYELKKKATSKIMFVESKATKGFTVEEKETLFLLLEKVANNLASKN